MVMAAIEAWVRDSRLYPWRVAERPKLMQLSLAGTPTKRPVDYSAKAHQHVLAAVSRGLRRKHAAAVAGVCEATFQRWYEKGRTIVSLLEKETVLLDGERVPVTFPTGLMLAYYNLYLDIRQAEAMAVLDATNAVRKHVTGYVIQGEWVEEQSALYYDADDVGYDADDPYKVRKKVKRLRWIPATRVQGDAGMAWRMLQRLDPDPSPTAASVTVNVDQSTHVDARKVEVYGFDLARVAEAEGLAGLRALAGEDDLGELLEG
mgnify:FL=1